MFTVPVHEHPVLVLKENVSVQADMTEDLDKFIVCH